MSKAAVKRAKKKAAAAANGAEGGKDEAAAHVNGAQDMSISAAPGNEEEGSDDEGDDTATTAEGASKKKKKKKCKHSLTDCIHCHKGLSTNKHRRSLLILFLMLVVQPRRKSLALTELPTVLVQQSKLILPLSPFISCSRTMSILRESGSLTKTSTLH